MTNAFLITDDDIIICDPEAEYFSLVQRLDGQVIRLSPTGKGIDGKPQYSSLTRQLAPSLAPVACNDLVAALFTGTDDTGRQNTAPRDTLHRFLHRFIIPHLERVIFERKQFCQWNFLHLFAVGLRFAASLKQVVKASQR